MRNLALSLPRSLMPVISQSKESRKRSISSRWPSRYMSSVTGYSASLLLDARDGIVMRLPLVADILLQMQGQRQTFARKTLRDGEMGWRQIESRGYAVMGFWHPTYVHPAAIPETPTVGKPFRINWSTLG